EYCELAEGGAEGESVLDLDISGEPHTLDHSARTPLAITKLRAIWVTVERPGENARSFAQKGILIRIQNRHRQTSRSIRFPLTDSPSASRPPELKKTRTAVASTSACATCTPSAAVIPRHHRRASPSVCGSACISSINGAPATRIRISAARTT